MKEIQNFLSYLRLKIVRNGYLRRIYDMIDFVDKPFYSEISDILASARSRTYAAVNAAMVDAYWNIGKSIVEKQSKLDRAEYGEQLIEQLSEKMVKDFGQGFDPTTLRKMRQFYLAFPDHDVLRRELSWTHYRRIIRIKDDKARLFYMNECAKGQWSTRQLVSDALKRIHEPRFAEKQTALNGELIPHQNARACPEALGPAL